ncbi:hypothetical protein M407DRAFT_30714 [Tulasnella calospora MUT 4182]|uniref:Uncharacterized protein n=1 Tax=Tulasnella calospora MUT 4182 TaxID=1051891 RepID=A0A0C3KDW6_9AGAM|nr:hypothetical protein M407DRAFT_30714 [Tulasnella calospora MUT 4182]
MKGPTIYLAAFAFLSTFISAAAVPHVASPGEVLAKRGGEVNYLANCIIRNPAYVTINYHASYIAWYSNVDNSLSGNDTPESLSNEYRDWAAGGEYLLWEGQQQNIYFPDSGVSVQTHIEGDGQSRAFTAWAGWAQRTSDGKTFNCYKDNGRQLFSINRGHHYGVPNTLTCNGIYWCV